MNVAKVWAPCCWDPGGNAKWHADLSWSYQNFECMQAHVGHTHWVTEVALSELHKLVSHWFQLNLGPISSQKESTKHMQTGWVKSSKHSKIFISSLHFLTCLSFSVRLISFRRICYWSQSIWRFTGLLSALTFLVRQSLTLTHSGLSTGAVQR